MTHSDRAALIAQTRTATIAECQRALRTTADHIDRQLSRTDIRDAVTDGYRRSADLLEMLKPPVLPGGTEKAS